MRLIRPTREMPGAPARANRGELARREDLRFRVSAPAGGRWSLIALAGVGLALGACSSSEFGTNVTGIIGGTSTVAIATNTGTTTVQEGQTLIFTAEVGGDVICPNTGLPCGVDWLLNGPGALTGRTPFSVTYTAPPLGSITGTETPFITATSIANPGNFGLLTVVVDGTPVIPKINLFPGYVSQPFGEEISANGGEPPFVWALATGSTLPAGLALNGSSGAATAIQGTPTSAGTYTFTLTASDALARAATQTFTLTVNPDALCILNGQYVMLEIGNDDGTTAVRAGSLNFSGTAGTVTGKVDTKLSASRTSTDQVNGTCRVRLTNSGILDALGALNNPEYDFSMTSNQSAGGALSLGRLSLVNGGLNEAGTGELRLQDPTAFNQAVLAGSFAFGLLGDDATSGNHMGVIGQLSIGPTGVILAGSTVDSNDGAAALVQVAATGQMNAPDATLGRGTLTVSAGAQTFNLTYYVVDANDLIVIDADTAASAPRLAGYMTRQAGTFDSTSLIPPTPFTSPPVGSIVSLWGAEGTALPTAADSLIRLSSPGLVSGSTTAGTASLFEDAGNEALEIIGYQPTNGASYTVAPNGRVTLTYLDESISTAPVQRNFVMYLSDVGQGYVIENGSPAGSAGVIEAQEPGPFAGTVIGTFVENTQFPTTSGPLLLLPDVTLTGGLFATTYGSGTFGVDGATGRAYGTAAVSGTVGGPAILYILQPKKMLLMQMGTLYRNSAIDWLID
jgi:Putative Ig domain